jgi:DNA-binding NtrC family response regulator
VILLDLLMPKMDGFQVLKQIKADSRLRHIPVIVISAVDEMDSVVRCIEMGAADYLTKPFDSVVLYARINASLAAKRLYDQEREYLRNVTCLTDAAAAVEAENFDPHSLIEVAARSDALGQLAQVFQRMAHEVSTRQQQLKQQVQEASKDRYRFGEIIGKSPSMQVVYEQILKAANSNANVVIYGESGTGKELVAQTTHNMSGRKKQKFVAVNCGAVPEALFESEFFGHRKGAFTGATMDKKGFFDRAHKGTLFLDEVGELSLTMQVKLLRALQDKEYTPLGSPVSKTADVRIIAATNRNLIEQLHKGLIREDFFYRIRVIVINLPPLRERREDIPLLIEHFLHQYGKDTEPPTVPARIIETLCAYSWPGNIRELQNELQRYLAEQQLEFIGNASGTPLGPDGMPGKDWKFYEAVEAYEKRLIVDALEQNQGRREKTAIMLGILPRTLHRKMKKYGLL